MCVTPLSRIQRAKVIATNEADSPIDYQQLAMIQGITTRIQQLPGTTHGTVFEHMNSRMKGRLEGAWDNEIAKAVKDDRDLNPLLGFAREMFLKFLANSIIFPDVRLKINTLLCRIDCLEHGVKKLSTLWKSLCLAPLKSGQGFFTLRKTHFFTRD